MRTRHSAFTLLEILLAVALLAVVATVTFVTFGTVVRAWRKGTELGEDLQHGDYVAEQLVMALRSAYYPSAANVVAAYGFWMEDNGSGMYTADKMSWVKLGHTLVGGDCPFAETPHRVEFWLDENTQDGTVVAVKAWRLHGQPEDFDPEAVEPVHLSNRVVGFNCRTACREVDEQIEWLDEWEETNRVPPLVEITLYLKPLDEGEDPVEIRRVVKVPIAPLSWKGVRLDGALWGG